jgi:hypothetical protein
MAATYTPIASITVGTASTTVSFSSIPQTYTDLVVVASVGNATTSSNMQIRFNSDTASNYSQTTLAGDGSTAASNRYSGATNISPIEREEVSDIANTYSFSIINIGNYSNTTTYKSTLSRSGTPNSSSPGTDVQAGLWRSTAAITSITLLVNTGSFTSGSTFNLYGILGANA